MIDCRFGATGLEYGHELVKVSEVLLAALECGKSKRKDALRQEALESAQTAIGIFTAHYGPDDKNVVTLKTKVAHLMNT